MHYMRAPRNARIRIFWYFEFEKPYEQICQTQLLAP